MLLYQGIDADESTDDHEGFIAGQRVDGGLTDIWTDVRGRRADRYRAFVPRCDCGWIGSVRAATPAGYVECERAWREQHLPSALGTRVVTASASLGPTVIHGGFVPEGLRAPAELTGATG